MARKDQPYLTVDDGGWTGSESRVRLVWWLPDEEDYGLVVGEGVNEGAAASFVRPTDTTDPNFDTQMAEFIASRDPTAEHGFQGFYWRQAADAKACLRRINAEVDAAMGGVPWPDWALTALANGWKPPKGWKPTKGAA